MRERKELKMMFTSVGRRVELMQQFRAAAMKLGIKLELIGADISESAPALRFCDQAVTVPRISDPEYIPALLSLCEKLKIDALVPTIDTDLYVLSCNKQRFADVGTRLIISDPDKIAICRDKRKTATYFDSIGLKAPCTVDNIENYTGGFPAFIKPVDGSSSKGASKVQTWEELKFLAEHLPDYIVQPFASGVEYTVDIFCDFEGKPIYITPRIRLAVREGEVLKTRVHYEETIFWDMLKLVDDFKPCGAITVQLIRNEETGENQYIEINPRFGGGAPITMQAGANAAEAMLRLLVGEKMPFIYRAADEGAAYSRFDQSVCVKRTDNTPVKAVVFDLDDTLFSEKAYVRSGYRQVAAVIPNVENAEEKLWNAFQNGKPAIDTVLQESGLFNETLKEKCLKAYRHQKPEISLYEGVPELLEELRIAGVQIGIITDGRPEGQQAKIQALGLENLVDSILITDELGGEQFRKPNDIAFRVMQMRLDVPFEEMVYVGDNPAKDFTAPRMLGMQWIYYCNEDGLYNSKEIAEENAVSSIEEMAGVLYQMI